MRVYFDKPNLDSYLSSSIDDEEGFINCNKMLSRYCDIFINATEEEMAIDQFYGLWVSLLTRKNPDMISPHFNNEFISLDRPIKSRDDFECKLNLEDNSSISLIEGNEIMSLNGNYLINEGNELNTLLSLRFKNEDKPYLDYLPIHTYFEDEAWSILNKYSLPCSDIIISDQFVLSDPTKIESSLCSLIKTLAPKEEFSHVNIVILTLLKSEKVEGSKETKYSEYDWNDIRDKIKSTLNEYEITANVSFVAPSNKHIFREHDRTIFTNYRFYTPGMGVGIYDANGKNSTFGRHFYIHSMVEKDNYSAAFDFINDMQAVIDTILGKKRRSGKNKFYGVINVELTTKPCNYLKLV